MVDYYLKMPGGLTALFKSASDIRQNKQALLQLGAYVPGISFLTSIPPSIDITLEHQISDIPQLTVNETDIRLSTLEGEEFPADLFHLFYALERQNLIKRGLYCVHAACVGNGDHYTLLLGHSGAGKTTLAQSLVENHNIKLFSGNKTVIRLEKSGSITAIAGTRTMTALDKSLNRFAYEMKFDEYSVAQEVNITSIAIIKLNDGVEETEKLKPLSALHTIYAYFIDAVNGDVIVNGKDVFDGSADKTSKENLVMQLDQTLQSIPVYKHSGNIDFLRQRILHP